MIIGFIIFLFFALSCFIILSISETIKNNKLSAKLYNLSETINELQHAIIRERKEAVKQSKSVIGGQINENIIPLFENFPYQLQDIKFSGNPLDYLVYEGMTKLRDTGEGEINIVFADVKTNTARNSKIQNAIKEAIIKNRVRFENWNIKENKLIINDKSRLLL